MPRQRPRSVSKKWNKLLMTTTIRFACNDRKSMRFIPHSTQTKARGEIIEEADVLSDTSVTSSESSSDDEKDVAATCGCDNHECVSATPTSDQIEALLLNASGHTRRKHDKSGKPKKSPKDSHRFTKNKEENLDPQSSDSPFQPQRCPRRSSMRNGTTEAKLRGRRNVAKRRRSITFNDNITIQEVVPARCLSPVNLWFHEQEYRKIRQGNFDLLSSLDAGGYRDRNKYCTRGLEKYMTSPWERQGMKCCAWDSVLIEQRLQRMLGVDCVDSIARLYKWVTFKSMEDALYRAHLDAKEAASLYREDIDYSAEALRMRRRVSAARTAK